MTTTSDGKEPPEVMQIRWLYTQAHLATLDAHKALEPGQRADTAAYMVLRAQLALLDAQLEHGRWLAP